MPSPYVKPLPHDLMVDDGSSFVDSVSDTDLVYFLLNVGDGDCQFILLPLDAKTKRRQAIVVDIASFRKLDGLLGVLETTDLFSEQVAATSEPFTVVVGTHPHADHIAGMPQFLDRYGDLIGEYWDSGYYHTSSGYQRTMTALEDHNGARLAVVQPTSGAVRFIGQVKLTVLTPAIGLKNSYDTYGIDLNNSSISLKLEFPASRVVQRDKDRSLFKTRTQSLILGADAQTVSWGRAMADFPELRPSDSPVAEAMGRAQGSYPLQADVFKVPHHGSKHGLNLELVETIKPAISLISSVSGAGKYNFPHLLSLESIREARNAIAGSVDGEHKPDHELGIHLTGGEDDQGNPLGSVALVMSSTSNKRSLWRFYDPPDTDIDLANARRFQSTP
ncbi:MAG TPA: MBL fold metallo-hydrolase [Solirubrobacterales bacterium]